MVDCARKAILAVSGRFGNLNFFLNFFLSG